MSAKQHCVCAPTRPLDEVRRCPLPAVRATNDTNGKAAPRTAKKLVKNRSGVEAAAGEWANGVAPDLDAHGSRKATTSPWRLELSSV